MSMACDICNERVDMNGTHSLKPADMRNAVRAGFSVRLITWGPLGNLAKLMSVVPGAAENAEADWKRSALTDATDWNCCPRCYECLQEFNQPLSSYEFRDPKLYSGFPATSLRHLFIHIPEPDVDAAKVSEDFVKVASDTLGEDIRELFGKVNVIFVTNSEMGDQVQKTASLPRQVAEQIESLYPETRDRARFPLHIRVFFSATQGRHGLLVFVYEAE